MTRRDVAPEAPERAPEQAREQYDVVVIGGGQAGLAVGYHLKRQGRRFVILERGSAIAPAWRERWNSLVLFTPRRFDALPGMPFPGEPDTEPSRDEVVAYLERYAAEFDLPVELDSHVRAVSQDDGCYVVETSGRTLRADNVVVATGPFQRPYVPAFAAELSGDVPQMHSSAYRRPDDLPDGTIVVVGGGNTGYQIAEELVATRTVYLAVGGRQTPLPRRLGGRHIFWWLDHLRLLDLNVGTRPGRRLSGRETLIGSSPRKSKRLGIRMKPRVVGVGDGTVRFADGNPVEADAVVWATGYQPDYGWLHVPVFDERGQPRHRRGVTDEAGLYFVGLQWQWTRGSALIGWVKHDASYIAGQIARTRTASASLPNGEPPPGRAGAYHEPVIVLREIEDADIATFHQYWTDDDALRMAAFTPADVHDRAAFEARWARQRADPSTLTRTIERDGEVVGSIGSWDAGGAREVTYWIGRSHWGQGVASQALRMFLELEQTRPLHAAAAADNVGSLRVLERCGFRVSGAGRGWSNARMTEVDEVELVLDS